MKIFILLFAVLPVFAADFPNTATRVKLFDQFVAEMERLDGEGLPARTNRPESWKATIKRLRKEAQAAKDPVDFGQVFHRLDQTYTNLHAQVTLHNDYEIAPDRKRPTVSARFRTEKIVRGTKNYRYRISSVSESMLASLDSTQRPVDGDELLQINGRDIQHWARENFIFCKFPYREQCESNFFDSFRKGFLGWDWRSPLEYTLKRGKRIWTTSIPVGTQPERKSASLSADTTGAVVKECPNGDNRYKDFKPVHKGLNVCVYESEKYPGIAVLNITSFAYRNIPETEPIRSVGAEVNFFNDNYWRTKSGSIKKLIIDVIDNGGGDTPVGWYQMFFDKPFQEQHVQFKKTPEFENTEIRKNMFYNDPSKDIWFKKLTASGTYGKLKIGAFLPHIPQFCADEKQSCELGKYEPSRHNFNGQIRILVNEWCISSCTGFVWNIKDKIGPRAKLVGMPDSGDSGYARLYVDAYLDPTATDGFRIATSARQPQSRQRLPDGAFVRQQVSATRSTDENGKIVSAIPATVEEFVVWEYKMSDEQWLHKAFEIAIKR